MSNLVTLHLKGRQRAAAPAAAAAAEAGHYSLPGTLVTLQLTDEIGIQGLVDSWVPHLAGCPHLQELEVCWGNNHEADTHPTALLQMLAQHGKRLRSLTASYGRTSRQWDLPMGNRPWRPDAALAAVTGLECLSAGDLLHFKAPGDWQHAAQLSALTSLTGARFFCAPDLQQAGAHLAVVQLEACCVYVEDGHELGRLLLSCPVLQSADLDLKRVHSSAQAPPAAAAAGAGAGRPPLPAHPTLKKLSLGPWFNWGNAAAVAPIFAALAPVLAGVTELNVKAWPGTRPPHLAAFAPQGTSNQGLSPLPDLSPCSTLESLVFGDAGSITMEQFCAMVGPLQQLQRIKVIGARQVNSSMVQQLQGSLPQLRRLQLTGCGQDQLWQVQDQPQPGFELVVE